MSNEPNYVKALDAYIWFGVGVVVGIAMCIGIVLI